MAKKTNKTEHVLSLLSGAGTTTEKEDSGSAKKDSQAQQEPRTDNRGSVHVVMAAGTQTDPVAEAVKEKLEKEFQEELAMQQEPQEAEEAVSIPSSAEQTVSEQGETVKESAPAGNETGQTIPAAEVIVTEEKDEDMDGYVFYNIMERIVKDKAMKYMNQFGNCTCRRCEADTIALALSKLPPKYVVAKEDSVSPLVNFYEDHYAGQVIVEITKACIVVNKNPRHTRK